MRKPTRRTRSARKQELRDAAHRASVKGTVPPNLTHSENRV